VNAAVRSELFKQQTTRYLLLSLAVLIAAVVALHVTSLPAADLRRSQGQLTILGMGTTFGMLFASLLGALSITGEIRTGLIRPTLLMTPRRERMLSAKFVSAAVGGFIVGLCAEGVAVIVASIGFSARSISIAPGLGQFTQLLAGGAVAAAAWAVIGVAVGALVRNQVATLVGLVVWLLFIEQTLGGLVPAAAKYSPGSSAGALAGAILNQTSSYLLPPAIGALLAAAYIAATTAAALVSTARRDFI
jgi:ABC-2 type transport system permease protein